MLLGSVRAGYAPVGTFILIIFLLVSPVAPASDESLLDDQQIEKGRRLSKILGCNQTCHAQDASGRVLHESDDVKLRLRDRIAG